METFFAHDLTCFLRNRSSYDCLQDCLSKFSRCSGLKVNEEMTEFLSLDTRNSEYEFPRESVKTELSNSWCAF